MINRDTSTPYRAGEYDKNVVKTLPYYHSFHQETIEIVKTLKPDVKTWLDTGSGSAALIFKAVNEFPNAHFYYADPSETMREVARSRLGQEKRTIFLDPCRTETLDQVTNEQFDVISAVMCHHYLDREQRKQAIRTCYNLLRPSGLLIIFEHTLYTNQSFNQVQMQRWREFQIRSGRPPEKVKHHLEQFGSHYLPITSGEHMELMTQTGFAGVEMFWRSYLQAGFAAWKLQE